MKNFDLIIFDMDGTLYDDIPEIISQYREAFSHEFLDHFLFIVST